VRAAIEELPASYRAALVLRDMEDWTSTEVADVMGTSVGTVKSRVHRARLFVRKRLAEALPVEEHPEPFRRIA